MKNNFKVCQQTGFLNVASYTLDSHGFLYVAS